MDSYVSTSEWQRNDNKVLKIWVKAKDFIHGFRYYSPLKAPLSMN